MSKPNQKKKLKEKTVVELPIVHPNAAGIDVSATMHAVAVRPGIEPNVKEFGAFTEDLHAIADWLKECKVTTVAMESTGVYWKQLYLVLTERGFDIALVNAARVKNVTGRKTDMDDAQWLQKLHSCGLLQSSFIPDDSSETLRNLVRHRNSLIADGSKYVNRMQKALELMNIKVQSEIKDIMGKTGRAIVEAIIAGERNPENFMVFVDRRIKADRETLKKSLTGNWRNDQLFLLEENYELYKYLHQRINKCNQEIELALQRQVAIANEGVIEAIAVSENEIAKKKPKKKNKNHTDFNVREYLEKINGVDVLEIYGISETTGLTIHSEIGTDITKWGNEKKFVAWLNLCPNNKITGGKLISSTVLKKNKGIASRAFRAAANGLQRSDNWLGDYFRRKKAKGGNKYAIVATAAKIAT
ncbi:MAG: IS110 family transposase, partial [Chitinophagaceae bacterium]